LIKKSQKIARLWNEILGTKKSNIGDNFFDLGGNSILTVKLLSKIKKETGVNILLYEFMDNPTQEYLLKKINGQLTGETQSKNSDSPWITDVSITFNVLKNIEKPVIKHIMLTGAAGFLGAHILSELLNKNDAIIHCLVRPYKNIDSIQKLRNVLDYYHIDFIDSRIKVYTADLSKPHLGLTKKVLNYLAKTIDCIYHVGAEVNHLYSYNKLRDSNVLGTIELIKLSNKFKRKPLHYVSTINVACTTQSLDTSIKNWPIKPPNTGEGYTLTKWVSEIVLYNAALQTGLPIKVFRPGNITGHSITGACKPNNNHIFLLLKGCIQLGCAPNWDFLIEMTPVDIVARVLVEESLRGKTKDKFSVYNLHNPLTISFQDFINSFCKDKYNIEIVDQEVWKNHLSMIDENNSLYYLKSLYIENEIEKNTPLNKIKTSLPDILSSSPYNQNIQNYESLFSLYRTYLNKIRYI